MEISEKKYLITHHSVWIFILVITLVICVENILLTKYIGFSGDNIILFILQFVIMLIVALYIAFIISGRKAEVKLNVKGYSHNSKNNEILIPWHYIDNYVYEQDRAFDKFTLNLKDGKQYKFHRLNIVPIKDDFQQLIVEFPEFRNQLNSNGFTNFKPIERGKTIYENKWFAWIFYCFTIMVSFAIIMELVNPSTWENWVRLGLMLSIILFYGKKIYSK